MTTDRDALLHTALTAACRVARPELDEADMGPGSLDARLRRIVTAAVDAVLDAPAQAALCGPDAGQAMDRVDELLDELEILLAAVGRGLGRARAELRPVAPDPDHMTI